LANDEENTGIIGACLASRKERKRYESTKDRFLGYPGIVGEAADRHATRWKAHARRRTEKINRFAAQC